LSPVLVHLARRFGGAVVFIILIYQLILLNLQYPGILRFTFPSWVHFLRPPVLGYTMAAWGIYFPLGLIYGLEARRITPWLQKIKWAVLAVTSVFFVLGFLYRAGIARFPLADYICPLIFVLLLPTFKRNSIPFVRQLEEIGKHSYGLYLTHLTVLDLALVGIHSLMPDLFTYQVLLLPPLLVVALALPLVVMAFIARLPTRSAYRYVFG